MATITEPGTRTSGLELYEKNVSSAIAVADTVVVQNPVSKNLSHCFISVQQDVLGTAGTYAITVKPENSEQFEPVTGSPINATGPVTLEFDANVSEIQCVPTGILTATTYQLVLTANAR